MMESKGLDVRGLDPWGLRRVEQLLHTIEGVDSLKIVPDGHGGIDEIHVLSSSGLGAKQIVRNIESALLAQFGLQVDHRKISIAQVRASDIEPLQPVDEAEPAVAEPPPARRLVLDTFHLERRAGERVVCRVELLSGDTTYLGQAEGPDYSRSRMEVAARAVLDALSKVAEGTMSFGVEGVTQVQLFGREMIVAAVQGFEGRSPVTLLGIAEVRDSIEESVVYACLGATNRWTSDS